MLTDIIYITTLNSHYEVRVMQEIGRDPVVACRKRGEEWRASSATDMSFLDKLVIGASFDVPGVVLTSIVQDYNHFVPSSEPKRRISDYGIAGAFQDLTAELVRQVKGQAQLHGGQAVVPNPSWKEKT